MALLGWVNATRTYVLMRLDSPSVTGRTVRFQAKLLTPSDQPKLADGPVGALMADYSLVRPPLHLCFNSLVQGPREKGGWR